MGTIYTDAQAGKEAEELSKKILAPISAYQKEQAQPGKAHVLVILSALAFVVAVLIARLPRRDYNEAHDWFQDNLKKAVEDIR